MKQNSVVFFSFLLLIVSGFLFAKKQDDKRYDLVIVGSGPAGLTAALFAAQMGLSVLVITGKEIGGQLNYAPKITNWPGVYEKPISGKELVQRLYQHAKGAGAPFLNEEVVEVDCLHKPFVLKTSTGKTIVSYSIIIATGSKPKLLGIPGEQQYWGNGISTCALCDGMLYKQKKVAIIGNGTKALHNVLHMINIADQIIVITEKKSLSGTKQLQEAVINNPKCTFLFECKPTAFHGTSNSGVTQLTYFDNTLNQEKTIDIDGAFVSIGSVPNTDLFSKQLQMDQNGQFPKTTDMVNTGIPGIFIAMPQQHHQAIICAGLGCAAALSANHYLKNQKKTETIQRKKTSF
jgi:thioredoxin reductase (NADPH)